ncbi:anaphase-promoting complex subunit 5 domain protein [Leptospira yasudae]|uniref:TPR end-of-group domain-containing protein n=1 Tax=Leptospira yasudae TaxID=2202201 RepID=UPI001C50086B|nr:anaphase-promoting complex subunit 5 domain protein [Leptospira yasudae]MBW0433900.1 anaphase-promoting complex subunit 5 domain protein [Leptospira yasudae]
MIFQPKDFQKETSRKYDSEFYGRLHTFDFDGAMQLLERIFQDKANQGRKGEPTDFLHDDDEEKKGTLSGHFKEMIEQFHFDEPLQHRVDRILEILEESVTEETLQSHRFKPFNGILFKMSDYEFCNAVADSIHFDAKTHEISSIFGLNHELIWDADSYPPEESSESYNFIYDLKSGKYKVSYLGEKLKGKNLHVHIKLLLFSKMIREIVETLLLNERFAKFPKAFPFYVLINADDCYDLDKKDRFLLEVRSPVELKDLANNPHQSLYEKSSEAKTPPSPLEEFLFSLDFLNKSDSNEFQTLLRLTHGEPQWKKFLERASQNSFLTYEKKKKEIESLEADAKNREFVSVLKKTLKFGPTEFSSFFWKLAQKDPHSHQEFAKRFQKQVFLNPPAPLEDGYKQALPYIQDFTYILTSSYVEIPEDFKKESEAYLQEAIDRMKHSPHPGFRIRAFEIEYRLKENNWEPSERHPIEKNPPEEYLDLMTELVRCLPEKFPWFGEAWDFVFEDRLLSLGQKAKRSVPAVIEVLERYNQEHFNEDVTRNIAPVLYKIGCEDIHPLIHQLHQRNEFYMEDFYHKWSKQAPANRWKQFAETIRTDIDSFTKASVWENLLYDSEPGFFLYYENIEKESDRNRIFDFLLTALQEDAGPILQRFAFFYCERIKKSAGKNKERFFEIVSEMTKLLQRLNAIEPLEPSHQFSLRCGFTARAIESYLNDEPNALERIQKTIEEFPKNYLLYFLKVSHIERKSGISKAIEELRSVLSILWKEDFVFTKAFFLYLLVSEHRWEILSAGKLYAFYGKVKINFEKDFFTDGKFSGRLDSFENDPFSKVLKEEYSKIVIDSHRSWLQSKTEEYEAVSKTDSLSIEELVASLKPGNSSLNLSIALRLIDQAVNFTEELLQILDWEETQEASFPILKLFYQNPHLKERLFENPIFQKNLGFFIKKYRDLSTNELSKSLFVKFKELQNSSVIVQTVAELGHETILNSFLSVHWAFQKEGKLSELGALMGDILNNMNSKKPEYVLTATNLSVIHIQNGNLEKAKEVAENLFSMDWSRFDYQKDEKDTFADKVLGGDLNEQYSAVFKQYYSLAHFNAACLYSRLGDPEKCVFHLKDANRLGPQNYNKAKILAEKDFETIKDHPVYQEFLNSIH